MLEIHAFKCPHGISAGGNEKTFHFLFPQEKRIMGDCDFIFFLLFFFLLYKFFITNMYCFFLVLLFNIYFFQTLNFYSVLGSIANYQCCGSFRWTVKNICCFCDQKKKLLRKDAMLKRKTYMITIHLHLCQINILLLPWLLLPRLYQRVRWTLSYISSVNHKMRQTFCLNLKLTRKQRNKTNPHTHK